MDPVTLAAVLGPALVTVLTKLAEKGVADPALKPLTDWLEKRTLGGYNQKKAEADLLKAVREALPPAGDSRDPSDLLKELRIEPERAAFAAVLGYSRPNLDWYYYSFRVVGAVPVSR